MRHTCLSVGVSEEEIGDLSLDKMPNPQLFRFGFAEDAPVPVYTSKTKYAALVPNLSNFSGGRKQSAPSVFSDNIDWDVTVTSRGSLIKSVAQAKAHLFLLCEAGAIKDDEMQFLHNRGWQTQRNNGGDLLVGCRTNRVESKMVQLAGSTLVGVAHHNLPCSYMVVEIKYGNTLPANQGGDRQDFPGAAFTAPLTRAGSNSVRVCVFHLDSGIAGDKVGLAHEALATMFTGCLRFQVDLICGDANMATYRAWGRKQGSADIKGGISQSLLDYFLEAWSRCSKVVPKCCPKHQTTTANSLCLLKQYEDQFGRPYTECSQPDWNTFPTLDPVVASVLKWGTLNGR